jgi:nicotinamidase/pyrazinamidase
MGVGELTICGLCLDFCVRATALDAVKEGFDVRVLVNLTKSVDNSPEGIVKVKDELTKAGVKLCNLEKDWLEHFYFCEI